MQCVSVHHIEKEKDGNQQDGKDRAESDNLH